MIIALEGIDGSGKGTQIQNLMAYFEKQGKKVVQLRFPGGPPLGEYLRSYFKGKELPPLSRFHAMMAIYHEFAEWEPMLEADVVICDRFFFSTLAYQGTEGVSMSYMMAGLQDVLRTITIRHPVHVLVLDLSVDIGLLRARNRGSDVKRDQFEMMKPEFHKSVADKMRWLASATHQEGVTSQLINANQSPEHVWGDIQANLKEIIAVKQA